jgi:hypothetical protein
MIKVKIKYRPTNKYENKTFKTYDELLDSLYLSLGQLDKPSDELSNLANLKRIPMFDIYNQNIVLVNSDEVYDKLLIFHYRPITNDTIKLMTKKKSVEFCKNFNLTILEQSFYKLIYQIGNAPTSELTTCVRPSFLPVLRTTTPYYTKMELIYLALNMNLKYENESKVADVCDAVRKNDISSDDLLKHQIYIKENLADNYIKYYSFLGSSVFNYYLRYPEQNHRNPLLEYHIKNFRSILIKSPEWDKSYYLYRWIKSDEYLQKLNLKIGDIWKDTGFLSTTRQAFVSRNKNYFGYILIKIKVPAGRQGCGLAVEFYSHFPEEQEIIFPPSKYKLISTTNTAYHHPDEYVSEKVTVKYEFEWIAHLSDDEYLDKTYMLSELEIPYFAVDANDSQLLIEKNLETFLRQYKVNFITTIGEEQVVFTVNKLITEEPYNHMFYSNYIDKNMRQYVKGKEIFLTWQSSNGNINLLIEISAVISVNYYFKYSGMQTELIGNFTYDDIILFICKLANYFNIESVVINSDYKKYSDIIPSYIPISKNMTYHDIQLYISDINYFNQSLHYYINTLYCGKDYTSSFSHYLTKNEYIYSQLQIVKHILNTPVKEFIEGMDRKMKLTINESYVELLFKLANKLANSKAAKEILQTSIKFAAKQARGTIANTNDTTILDLYIYIILNYNYLIPYLHSYINEEYNFNLANITYVLDWQKILNVSKDIFYTVPMRPMDIKIDSDLKLIKVRKVIKKYTLVD